MSESALVPIQFGTQIAEHKSGPLSQELAENLYLEPAPNGSKFQYTLLGTPGLEVFTTPQADGPVRGLIVFQHKVFAVIKNTLYRVDSNGTSTSIGTIEGTGLVSMAENGQYIWIAVPGGKLYAANTTDLYDLSSDLSEVIAVTAQDGYIAAAVGGDNIWYLSGLDTLANDGAEIIYTSADSLPGFCVSIVSDHREILVFKEDSIEVYQNTGNADFPFGRSQVIEKGCRASQSVAKDQNMVFWLGQDLRVYAMPGYQPNPISTDTIVHLIEQTSDPSTARGWTYQQGGHSFYVLSFTDLTLCYDININLWHKRKSKGLDRWRAGTYVHVPFWGTGKHIVGDYASGVLYEMKLDVYSEDNVSIIRKAVGAPLWNNGRRFIVDEFFLDAEAGVGIQRSREDDWANATAYVVDDTVESHGNVYICTTAGTSATDPVMTLLNDIKDQYEAHRQETGSIHEITDSTNTISASAATTYATAVALAEELATDYTAHCTQSGIHAVDDETNVLTADTTPTTLEELRLLANDLRTQYEAHRQDATVHDSIGVM